MFVEETVVADKRPFLAVAAPRHEFVLKYFDRAFDRRITGNPEEADGDMPAFVLLDKDAGTESVKDFLARCGRLGRRVVILRVPAAVVGTGMGDPVMRLARGVARGTMMKIRDNAAVLSVIHAVDIANVALHVARNRPESAEYAVTAPPVRVNDLLDALSFRIKNKAVSTVSPRWARILYGARLYGELTADAVMDGSSFAETFPDFTFINPVEYLKSHEYDNESL